jgi:hypothetical protein
MSVANICHILHIIDGATEATIDAIEISPFDLSAFCKQFDVPVEHDPQMLDRYVVGPDDVLFLSQKLPFPITFDFTSRGYWIEAVKRD